MSKAAGQGDDEGPQKADMKGQTEIEATHRASRLSPAGSVTSGPNDYKRWTVKSLPPGLTARRRRHGITDTLSVMAGGRSSVCRRSPDRSRDVPLAAASKAWPLSQAIRGGVRLGPPRQPRPTNWSSSAGQLERQKHVARRLGRPVATASCGQWPCGTSGTRAQSKMILRGELLDLQQFH